MSDCIKRIVEKSNGLIKANEAKELLDTVDRIAQRKVREGFDYDDSVKGVIQERMKNVEENLMKQKANISKNIIVRASKVNKINEFINQGLSLKEAFRAEIEGIESPIQGVKASFQTSKEGVQSAYFSKLVGDLSKKDLLPLFNSKKLNKQIGEELWALSKGESVAKNKQAKEIAKIVFNTLEMQRKRLNKAGADIGEVEGYMMPQRHDEYEMHRAGKDEWIKFMRPLLDESRSFGGDYGDLDQALSQAFDAMITGTRLDDPTAKDAKLFQFSGPANLAKKLSRSRQLIFKDYNSWQKWNDRFGSKDLNDGLIDAVNNGAYNIALLERYGTNPEAMLKTVADDIKKLNRGKAAKANEKGIDSLVNTLIDSVMQKNMQAANPTLARIGSNTRMLNNVTMLGGALISSITDIPIKALEYKHQGKTWLSATTQPFRDMATFFENPKDKAEFGSLLGVFSETMVGDIAGRFSAQDNLSQKAGKVQRLFFKLNGLAKWTEDHKFAFSRTMAHHLGLKKNTSFKDLDADTKRLFGNYNITEKDWDIMRKTATKAEDGRDYILAEFIDDQKLKEKYIGYMVDRRDSAVLQPSMREQRIATWGTQRGTPAGELARLVMQFKSFPITMITKVWGKTLHAKGKADVPAMVYLTLMTGAFGYLAGMGKDLVKGRTPKDPTKTETVFASFAQGGGLGILGDLLLTEYGFGRSATAVLAGPTASRLDDLLEIYSAGVRGEGSGSQVLKTGLSYFPGNNIFYARAAVDQMFLLQMQEKLSPGYLSRMERNLEKTYGQELFLK